MQFGCFLGIRKGNPNAFCDSSRKSSTGAPGDPATEFGKVEKSPVPSAVAIPISET